MSFKAGQLDALDGGLLSWDELFDDDSVMRSMGENGPAANEPVRDQKYWEDLFNQMNFPGMDLMAVSYFGAFDIPEKRAQFRRMSRDFLRHLSYQYPMDLRAAGVSEEGIFYMKKGKLPENFTVHMKYPLEYGGTVDFKNMVLIQEKPFHNFIHIYLEKQLIGKDGLQTPPLLYVPVPPTRIYVPFGLFTGSGGKNKQDRSAVSGYSTSELAALAMRAMPGRSGER